MKLTSIHSLIYLHQLPLLENLISKKKKFTYHLTTSGGSTSMEGRRRCRGMVMRPLVTLVAVLVIVVKGTLLQCGDTCTCKETKTGYENDYKVMCNASSLQEATLTGKVFARVTGQFRVADTRALVTVNGGRSLALTVDLDFILQWRNFSICSLDVIGTDGGGGSVIFPAVIPHFNPDNIYNHHFIGVTLAGMTASEVPVGILSGKTAGGLRLVNANVGRLPAGLLKGTNKLCRLHIRNSTVGVMEELVGESVLRTDTWLNEKQPIKIVNSTVGVMKGGAIHLKMLANQKIILKGVSLGSVDSGALKVESGQVEVEKCGASRVEAGALVMGKMARLTLRDNWLALEPDALTEVSCGNDQKHRVVNNYFSVLHSGAAIPVTFTVHKTQPEGDLQEEIIAERKRLVGVLSTVIHPSCVPYNLAPLPSTLPSQAPVQSFPNPHKLVMFGFLGLVIGIVAATIILLSIQRCYRNCRRRRRNRHVMPDTIVMSQLPDEPIYFEPSSCNNKPPELPPFPSTLSRPRDCSQDSTGACCTPDGGDKVEKVENDYIVMKGQ